MGMKKGGENMEILEVLKTKLQLEYISDLCFLNDREELKMYVHAIPEERYSISEWNDAAKYLTGKDIDHTTKTSAKKSIIG